MEPNYGICPICANKLKPIWFVEKEYKTIQGTLIKTGRERLAVSHLECVCCGHRETVDDTFDKPWVYRSIREEES